MSEFEKLLSKESEARARKAAEQRKREAAAAEVARLEEAARLNRLGREYEGTSPELVFGDRAGILSEFMEKMKSSHYRGAKAIISGVQVAPKSFMQRVLNQPATRYALTVRGYPIGRQVVDRKPVDVYYCADDKLRLESGKSLESEEVQTGEITPFTRQVADPDARYPRTVTGTDFAPLELEDTLVTIALKHLPQN